MLIKKKRSSLKQLLFELIVKESILNQRWRNTLRIVKENNQDIHEGVLKHGKYGE